MVGVPTELINIRWVFMKLIIDNSVRLVDGSIIW